MDIPLKTDLSGETLTGAPPPPQEVKVRTMASDLATMAASGGGLPRYQNVKIAGVAASQDPQAKMRKTSMIVAIISIVAVIAILLIGYLIYIKLG